MKLTLPALSILTVAFIFGCMTPYYTSTTRTVKRTTYTANYGLHPVFRAVRKATVCDCSNATGDLRPSAEWRRRRL